MSARLFVCVCVSVYVSDRSFRIEVFVDTEFCFLVTYWYLQVRAIVVYPELKELFQDANRAMNQVDSK